MAAILPHLEQPDETTDIEQAYFECTAPLAGLGEADAACPSPSAVIADSHAGLVTLAYVREAVYGLLDGRGFVVQAGTRDGKDMRTVYMILVDAQGQPEPVGPGPAWNPTTDASIKKFKLLSWTSKMNTPSWSLPAGALVLGGACPGALGGQSVVGDTALAGAAKLVNLGLDRPADAKVNVANAICQHCYATGGQYSTSNVQYAQILRYLWTRQAINQRVPDPVTGDPEGSSVFIETMVYAIQNANYRLDGGQRDEEDETTTPLAGPGDKPTKPKEPLPPEPSRRRFFRLHDSGDFFSPEYLRQWKQIANRLPDITFWAPSRSWATSWGLKGVDSVDTINTPPANLVIRPSAYEVGDAGPVLGEGWAAATTVLRVIDNAGMRPDWEQHVASREARNDAPRAGTDPRYDWDCRAYATDDKKATCRKAVAPPGAGDPKTGKGCRACWLFPELRVNYSLH
jgi:hypothetical protein